MLIFALQPLNHYTILKYLFIVFTCALLAESTGCKKAADNTSCPDWAIYIPNSFTPNGDGINDGFGPKGYGVSGYEMWVYNNTGGLVFHTTDFNNLWYGNVNGNSAVIYQEGSYAYKINVTDHCGIKHSYSGNVFLLK